MRSPDQHVNERRDACRERNLRTKQKRVYILSAAVIPAEFRNSAEPRSELVLAREQPPVQITGAWSIIKMEVGIAAIDFHFVLRIRLRTGARSRCQGSQK
jgi:hypothetical protein